MVETPNVYCLVSGAAEGNTRLNAFDNALLEAGVGDTNLMRMSSICPPGAKEVSRETQPGVIMEFEDHTRLEYVETIVKQMVVDAFEYRKRALKEIKFVGVEHQVTKCAATFAAAVLWYED